MKAMSMRGTSLALPKGELSKPQVLTERVKAKQNVIKVIYKVNVIGIQKRTPVFVTDDETLSVIGYANATSP